MSDLSRVELVPPNPDLNASYNSCVGVVAEERRYISITHPPSIDDTSNFIESVRAVDGQIMLAVTGDQVVGWCTTRPHTAEMFRHIADIGMGLLPEFRGRGIGRRLIDNGLTWAWESGFEQVELSVLTNNDIAVKLYRSVGFVEQGVRRRVWKLDGEYRDIMLMAVSRPVRASVPPACP